jgi:hypothetical protein
MGFALSIAAAAASTCATTGCSFVGSPRGPSAVVGPAPGRRAAQAFRGDGDILESAGSSMGSTKTRHAPATASARRCRLGPASRGSGAAADRGALLGRAGRCCMGCAEDRGACGSRRAVVVSTCRASIGAGRASGRAGRGSAPMECPSTNRRVVGARPRCRRTRSSAGTLNRRHAGRRRRKRVGSG